MSCSDHELEQYLAFAHELADAAGAASLPYFRTRLAVDNKAAGRYDPVTQADRAAEQAMRALIRDRYPQHAIVGEEAGIEAAARAGASPMAWVLDPIDGTRAFVTGLPLWGTLIALNDGAAPLLGIMDQPFTRERYVGTPHGAWCNGRALRTRACPSLAEARLMCTSPDIFDEHQRRGFGLIAGGAQLVRFGGDCYAYCMLASGFVDVVIEAGLNSYDIQALMPIIAGAGGIVTSWDGGDAQHGGTVIACGDTSLHGQLVARLRAYA